MDNFEEQDKNSFPENKDSGSDNLDRKKRIMNEVWEYVKMIITVVLVVLFVDGVILINAKIPSASMETTVMTGDRIFGIRLAYGINWNIFGKKISIKYKEPERYDIVIFHYPDNEKELYIKRIIGLPGETVDIREGKVYVSKDGGPEEMLDDSFVNARLYTGDNGPFEVPEDCYFMLGDNRSNSKDSRYWTNKYVRFDQIVARALFRYFPLTKFKILLNS